MSDTFHSLYHDSCIGFALDFLKNNVLDILTFKPDSCPCCLNPITISESYFLSNPSRFTIPYNQYSLDKYSNLLKVNPDDGKYIFVNHINKFFEKDKKLNDIVRYSSWIINLNRDIFPDHKKSDAIDSMKRKIISEMIMEMYRHHAIYWKIKFIESNRYVVADDLDIPINEIACHINFTQDVQLSNPKEAVFVKNSIKFSLATLGLPMPKTEIHAFDDNGKALKWYIINEKMEKTFMEKVQ
jgi:hypothetical protein